MELPNKKLLTDYHLHPNLPLSKKAAVRKCRKLWRTFEEQGVDVVIVTEHVFKNPERAYRELLAARPANSPVTIFPGIEALTREGVDFIIFSRRPTIYDHRKIMVPKQLSVFEMIEYINSNDELFGSIAHPFGPGNSSIINRIGVEDSIKAIQELGAVELHNACFRGGKIFTDRTGLSRVFKKQRALAELVDPLPEEYYKDANIKLFTGGSDAHVPEEIGSGLYVTAPDSDNDDDIFKAVSTNTDGEFVTTGQRIYFWLSIYKTYSVIRESLTKAFRLYEGRVYQQDDKFTNFYSEAEKEAVLALRKHRSIVLKPLLSFLTYFSVTPATLNTISVTSIFGSLIIVSYYPRIGVLWYCLYLAATSLTGALADYQDRASEANAITKIGVQYTALLAPVLATIWFEWADPFWAAAYLGFYTIMLWLVITLNQVGQPIRFVVRSKFVIITAIFVYLLLNFNAITPLLILFTVYMGATNVYMFFRYRNTMRTQREKDEMFIDLERFGL